MIQRKYDYPWWTYIPYGIPLYYVLYCAFTGKQVTQSLPLSIIIAIAPLLVHYFIVAYFGVPRTGKKVKINGVNFHVANSYISDNDREIYILGEPEVIEDGSYA